MRWASAGRAIGLAIAGAAGVSLSATRVRAQPAFFPAVSFGAVAIYSAGVAFPSLSGGLSGSVDILTDDRVTYRVSATGSAPIEYEARVVCGSGSPPSCFDSARYASQVVSFTGDVAFRPFGSEARMAVVARVGEYRATPAQTDGGSFTEPVSGLVYGLGVESDLGDDTPRFRVGLHALQYRDMYRQSPWGFALNLSVVLPR
jgi:hypothetical protein